MGIARDLVALERSLRAQVVDPFAAIEQSGLLRSPEVAQVLVVCNRDTPTIQ